MNGLNMQGLEQSYDDATLAVYGMPLKEWKKQYQSKASEVDAWVRVHVVHPRTDQYVPLTHAHT